MIKTLTKKYTKEEAAKRHKGEGAWRMAGTDLDNLFLQITEDTREVAAARVLVEWTDYLRKDEIRPANMRDQIRAEAGVKSDKVPIVVIGGDAAPTATGRGKRRVVTVGAFWVEGLHARQ